MTRMRDVVRLAAIVAIASVVAASPTTARGDDDDVLLEFHYRPVENLQIAIWLTDEDGAFVQDVFVTQATGTLGIGNRPGRWDFLSSWRFPYGERPQVLPVWAHARGKTYPHITFHDDTDLDSLGWHENASSIEPFFCRPLKPEEQSALLVADVMSCPSPAVFQSDKGRFDGVATSPYPPRSDLTAFEDDGDHPDIRMYPAINDLDAVTGATPAGDDDVLATTLVPRAVAEQGRLVAWIEVSLEGDQNLSWEFDREDDHFVDPYLEDYGIAYFGQPSIVYKVELDPMAKGFVVTDAYAGYGAFDGLSGTLSPPDATITETGGSGADRLQLLTKSDLAFRFGVCSHGPMSGSGDGEDDDACGSCARTELPAVVDFALEPISFDVVRVHFTIPEDAQMSDDGAVTLFYRPGDMPITEADASSAIQVTPSLDECDEPPAPGVSTWCEIHELFGNFDYQIGIRYADVCSNESPIVAAEVTTPKQTFATVGGPCFVATAAWGAPWTDRVTALRRVRDRAMRASAFGSALVEFYRAHGPMLAAAIADRPWARALARAALAPAADLARVVLPR
ncbi:MAG TPA: CFI-box-CTERM domain-containing protein [Nannocystaceae bacterium]|nr:CFI-box-CTERM domain-containing protein [Nannocystaceae bacterium]